MPRLIVCQVLMHACMVGMRMAIPLWALRLGHGPVVVGALLSCFSLTQVVLALPAGRYIDRVGLHTPLRAAAWMALGGGMGAACWPIVPVLGLSALVCGGASGMTIMAMQRYVASQARGPEQLKSMFSWLAIGPAIANVIGPLIAGALIDHAGAQPQDRIGFQIAFGGLALLPVLSWLSVQRLPPVSLPSRGVTEPSRRMRDFWALPGMKRLMLVNGVLCWCYDAHTVLVPMLGHERGLSASVMGAILASFAMAATTIRLVLPWLSRHVHEYQLIAVALLVSGVAWLIYSWLDSPWALGVCSMVLGLTLAAVQPMIMSLLHRMTPEPRLGEALGLRLMLINGSNMVTPSVFGVAAAGWGLAVVFGLVGGLAIMTVPQAWRLRVGLI